MCTVRRSVRNAECRAHRSVGAGWRRYAPSGLLCGKGLELGCFISVSRAGTGAPAKHQVLVCALKMELRASAVLWGSCSHGQSWPSTRQWDPGGRGAGQGGEAAVLHAAEGLSEGSGRLQEVGD